MWSAKLKYTASSENNIQRGFAQTHAPFPIKDSTHSGREKEKGENENVDNFSSTDFFWFIFVTSMETEIYNENIWEYRFE